MPYAPSGSNRNRRRRTTTTNLENKMGGKCNMQGKMRNWYKILYGKPEGIRPFGKYRHRREDYITADLK
jgi:hypothetical protein